MWEVFKYYKIIFYINNLLDAYTRRVYYVLPGRYYSIRKLSFQFIDKVCTLHTHYAYSNIWTDYNPIKTFQTEERRDITQKTLLSIILNFLWDTEINLFHIFLQCCQNRRKTCIYSYFWYDPLTLNR